MRKALLILAVLLAVPVALAVLSPGESVADPAKPAPPATEPAPESARGDDGAPFTPVKGKPPKPPEEACCDPALEPGANGNPLCFEGHTCCFDGRWSCNNPDGSPSCKAGTVCEAGCGSRGDSCTVNADCCANKCKGGRCR